MCTFAPGTDGYDLAVNFGGRAGGDNFGTEDILESARQVGGFAGFAIAGAFAVHPGFPPGGPVLLVDDLVDSRWTIAVLAMQLAEAGSGPVYPFALAYPFVALDYIYSSTSS